MAARGSRDMDNGEEKIADGQLVSALRAKATRVHVLSLITAALLTAATILIAR
ncbi:MAG TPA: hypothetical protein VGX92_02700 [Pyrinomonadaceae bacterium]|nr:hypothetical protein [Pyrinomonadaceae bacterium]